MERCSGCGRAEQRERTEDRKNGFARSVDKDIFCSGLEYHVFGLLKSLERRFKKKKCHEYKNYIALDYKRHFVGEIYY